MFNKLTSPFSKLQTNQRAPSITSPQVVVTAPIIDLTIVRREILLLYDRWTRADSGGFHRLLKGYIALLEDEDFVKNFESIIPNSKGSIFFSDDIKKRALLNLHSRRNRILQDLHKCLASLSTTIEATMKLSEKYSSDPEVSRYVDAMGIAMKNLVSLRQSIVSHIGDNVDKLNFTTDFEMLSFFLLMVAETVEDFVPRQAWATLKNPNGPRTLEQVQDGDGRNLFKPKHH